VRLIISTKVVGVLYFITKHNKITMLTPDNTVTVTKVIDLPLNRDDQGFKFHPDHFYLWETTTLY
jgi:hypothetical protein